MKKAGYILALLLEIAALTGAYIVNYFTRKKMGMARYVIYKNQGWERDYPMELIKNSVMAALLLLTILVLVFFLKRRRKAARLCAVMNLVMVALTGLYVGDTLFSSTETMRAYYFISLLFAIAAAVQVVKTGICVLTDGKKRDGV